MSKCCDIHAGMLDQRVAFERLTSADDGYGGTTETWTPTPAETVPVSLRPLSGSEAYRAMRIAPTATYRLYCRFTPDALGNPFYTPADRVLFQGRYFNILNVFDVEMAGRWIEMLLNEGALS
jgi:SPP1 family predicted phage head-tail adaptor